MGAMRAAVKVAARVADTVRRPESGLVVLLYHRVGATTNVSVDLPAPMFDEQMAMVAACGRVLHLDDAIARLRAGECLAGSFVVTFDDGTADFVDHALPVLERHGVPVALYLATRFVEDGVDFPDDGRPATWAALDESLATGLVTIGSHTHSHALLDRLAAHEVADELDRSIGLVHDRLGVAVDHFAYPKGLPPTGAADAAVRARFLSAALAGTRANPIGTDPYRLTRSPVQVGDGRRWFAHKLTGRMALEDDLRTALDRVRHSGAEV